MSTLKSSTSKGEAMQQSRRGIVHPLFSRETHVHNGGSENRSSYVPRRLPSGYFKQKISAEVLDGLPESEVDPVQGNDEKRAGIAEGAHSSFGGNADVSEKNKKSLVEQKRFYQRKLTGITTRLFRLLKPPLERRNSCPVLSEQKPVQRPPSDKQQGRSCRLTKWISHSELKSLTTVSSRSVSQDKVNTKLKEEDGLGLTNVEKSIDTVGLSKDIAKDYSTYSREYKDIPSCNVEKVHGLNSLSEQRLKDGGVVNAVEENIRLNLELVAQEAFQEAKPSISNSVVNNLSNARLCSNNDPKCLGGGFLTNTSKILFSKSPILTFGCSNGLMDNKTKQSNIDDTSNRNITSYEKDLKTDNSTKGTEDNINSPNTCIGHEVIKLRSITNKTKEPIYAVVNKTSVHQSYSEFNKETEISNSEKTYCAPNGFIVCNGSLNNIKTDIHLNTSDTKQLENEYQKFDKISQEDESFQQNITISNNFMSSDRETDRNGSIKSQINVICKQANDGQTNHCQNGGIRISISNGRNDVLDFGESAMNALANEFQSCQINECYNVKLDAPEEVIVAGFHDFCHTMLSLEESLEGHDTGTVKRNPGYKRNKNSNSSEQNGTELNECVNSQELSLSQTLFQEQNLECDTPISSSLTDKLLEDIQNSKSLGKMSLKDPDVMDAIQTLEDSLMEHSDDSYVDVSDSNPKINNAMTEISPSLSKIIKEDKIQCDNLIEELMLEDINKKITPSDSIAISISNQRVVNHFEIDEKRIHHTDNSDFWLSTKLCTEKSLESVSDVNSSNLDEDSYGSDLGDSDEATKRMNQSFDTKSAESSLLEVSRECSDLTNHGDARRTVLQDACNRTSPCSVDSGTSSHHGFFVVVAIDFGTTYSGYAFSFTRDPDNIHMMKKWEGGDPGVFNQKTPTTLLLTPECTFHSFGNSARDYYHDLDEEEAKGWLFFEKFKMTLHHNEHLSLETKIAAANGQSMPAVTVFAHALRYFKDHALQELSDQSATRILNEDVRWVVTVPAIWKQPAKQFMRAAAYQAGIAGPEYPEQLLIALEPEAASIYCRRIRLHQLVPDDTHMQRSCYQWQKDTDSETSSTTNDKEFSSLAMSGIGNDGNFTIGTRYMVVDCGGGTVDITVHELLDKQGTLKELQKASGGPYGSIRVDMEFEKLLCDIFGEDFIQQFKAKRPIGYVDLMIAFEARKRNVNPYKNNPLNISLPFSFIDFYKKFKGSSVENTMKKSSHKNVKWSSQGMLRLEPCVMEGLFKRTVEKIRLEIENIINEKDMNIDHIFLVGGFAESLILQKEIKDAFSSTVKVVIPQGVSLAILKGAVLYGLDPTAINIRRLRMTYGVGVLNRFIHGVHPREKLVVKDGIQWCADVFDKFVVNEQSVNVGDVVVRCYTPAKDGQSCSVIHIYCSEREDIFFITDPGVKRCATLILDLSESRYVQAREIQTQMMFGDTEIKVSALDVTTGKCVKADIDFLNL